MAASSDLESLSCRLTSCHKLIVWYVLWGVAAASNTLHTPVPFNADIASAWGRKYSRGTRLCDEYDQCSAPAQVAAASPAHGCAVVRIGIQDHLS